MQHGHCVHAYCATPLQLPRRAAHIRPRPVRAAPCRQSSQRRCSFNPDSSAVSTSGLPDANGASNSSGAGDSTDSSGSGSVGNGANKRRSSSKALSTAELSQADDKWDLHHPADDGETAEGQLDTSLSLDGEPKRSITAGGRVSAPDANGSSPPGPASDSVSPKTPAPASASGSAQSSASADSHDGNGAVLGSADVDSSADDDATDSIADTGSSQWETTIDRSAFDIPAQGPTNGASLDQNLTGAGMGSRQSNGGTLADDAAHEGTSGATSGSGRGSSMSSEAGSGTSIEWDDEAEDAATVIETGAAARVLSQEAAASGEGPSASQIRLGQEFADRTPTGSPASSMGSPNESPVTSPSSSISGASVAGYVTCDGISAESLAEAASSEAAGDGDSPISIPAAAAAVQSSTAQVGSAPSYDLDASNSSRDGGGSASGSGSGGGGSGGGGVSESADIAATGGKLGKQLWNEAQDAQAVAALPPRCSSAATNTRTHRNSQS